MDFRLGQVAQFLAHPLKDFGGQEIVKAAMRIGLVGAVFLGSRFPAARAASIGSNKVSGSIGRTGADTGFLVTR
ncbi:hypothetical protein PE067_06595 [Paracoccus sp. DMF-8]|uniref:hypothetical protein n=1 Tax=Paracoccus sp. DMF-8 TaxID=3019445 RepID=UPI0023E7D023|nr:hypothetical protein [Paracoccus sp. DMF-8]MDF3605845.1 hypothetical protein [Paracoccus sp. DMF-8]